MMDCSMVAESVINQRGKQATEKTLDQLIDGFIEALEIIAFLYLLGKAEADGQNGKL